MNRRKLPQASRRFNENMQRDFKQIIKVNLSELPLVIRLQRDGFHTTNFPSAE
jgi:hypothetical protein